MRWSNAEELVGRRNNGRTNRSHVGLRRREGGLQSILSAALPPGT
jgi:hypothetical protein